MLLDRLTSKTVASLNAGRADEFLKCDDIGVRYRRPALWPCALNSQSRPLAVGRVSLLVRVFRRVPVPEGHAVAGRCGTDGRRTGADSSAVNDEDTVAVRPVKVGEQRGWEVDLTAAWSQGDPRSSFWFAEGPS